MRHSFSISQLAFVVGAFLIQGCGAVLPSPEGKSPIDISNVQEAWDANNHPSRLRGRFELRLQVLPMSGNIAQQAWTDTYWPSYRAGLAWRWNDQASTDSFKYATPTRERLRRMTLVEKARLSPAEKYDILLGRYEYPLVNLERGRTAPDNPTWYGLCHGWAAAALNFKEPAPVTMRSVDGIDVPFGSSDVKALLTYVQQYKPTRGPSRMLGGRCNDDLRDRPDAARDPQCRDINAGSFHIILGNHVGFDRTAVIADFVRDRQVWNHPILGYSSRILSQSHAIPATAAPGTVRIVNLRTTVRYLSGMQPSWDKRPAASFPQQIKTRTFTYYVELNARGEIIGGEWSTFDRPDFLWTQERPQFSGYFAKVREIYQRSAR